ncbi:C-4 sterol methyl oxidase, partial [Linderina pennispora]
VHHEFSAPFGMAAEYAHPLETIIFGQGTIGSPVLYCNFVGSVHSVTMFAWIALRLFQAIDAHSGYDFPWSLHNFMPFWAGADHHDYHHMAFVNNFSSSFRWWDTIFGTDSRYHAHKARQAKAAEAKKAN